jgi:hypothetical protein
MIPAGIISADGHVCEPANCYVDYIDPKYRDTAPHRVVQDDGTEVFVVPGMKRPVGLGFIDGAGFGPRERLERAKTLKFSDVRLGAYRGKERLPYMDQDGIAAELIYASVGMGISMHRDGQYKDACMWAYNRWLAEMCRSSDRSAVPDGGAEHRRRHRRLSAGQGHGLRRHDDAGDAVYEDYDHPDYNAVCATDLDLRSASTSSHRGPAASTPKREDTR